MNSRLVAILTCDFFGLGPGPELAGGAGGRDEWPFAADFPGLATTCGAGESKSESESIVIVSAASAASRTMRAAAISFGVKRAIDDGGKRGEGGTRRALKKEESDI